MRYFADTVLLPFMRASGYRNICEIGAQLGANTERMQSDPSLRLTVVDPCWDADLSAAYQGQDRIKVAKGLSLDVLPTLAAPFDCILIDGDHNWYTVFNELKVIHDRALLLPGGTIFLHDVEWPCGRRDLYYNLDTVPVESRQPCARKGVVRGQSALSDGPALNDGLWNADHEGGARNGVLTAIEDFLAAHRHEYFFFTITTEYGLGVLQRRAGPLPNRAYTVALARETVRRSLEATKDWASRRFPALYNRVKSLVRG